MKYSKTLLLSSICASLMFGSSVEGVGLFDIFKSKKEKKQKVDKNSNKVAKKSTESSQKSTEVLKNSSEVTQKSSNGVIGKAGNDAQTNGFAKGKVLAKKGAKNKEKVGAKSEDDTKNSKILAKKALNSNGFVQGVATSADNDEVGDDCAIIMPKEAFEIKNPKTPTKTESNSLSNGYASTQNLSENTSDVKKDPFELSNIINPNDFRDSILAEKQKINSENNIQEAVEILETAKKIQKMLNFNPLNENELLSEYESERTKNFDKTNPLFKLAQYQDLFSASTKIGELMIVGNLKNDIPQRPIHQVFGDSKFRKNVEKAIALKIYCLQILLNSLLSNNLQDNMANAAKMCINSVIAHHASTILYLAPNYIFNEKLHKYLLNFCAKSFAVASLRFENRVLWISLIGPVLESYYVFIENYTDSKIFDIALNKLFLPLIQNK